MPHPTSLFLLHASSPRPVPPGAERGRLRAIAMCLRQAWRTLLTDERTRFLSGAANAGELEQRLRQWDDYCVNRAWQRTLY